MSTTMKLPATVRHQLTWAPWLLLAGYCTGHWGDHIWPWVVLIAVGAGMAWFTPGLRTPRNTPDNP